MSGLSLRRLTEESRPPTRRRILGLDLAIKTGWCFGEWDGSIIESGVQDITNQRGESPGMRFLRFRRWIEHFLVGDELGAGNALGIDLVVYELPHLRGGAAATLLVGLETRVHEACAVAGIEHAKVHTATLKKFACGGGKASKEQMIAAATHFMSRPPIDDNEADAVHVYRWAAKEYGSA